jgi:hypothetical protein
VIKPGDQGNKKGTKELNTVEYPLILNNDDEMAAKLLNATSTPLC